MINLNVGNNTAFVTLRERAELTNADILINFIFRDETSKNKVIKTSDVSLSTDRVSQVPIEVVTTEGAEDLDNAKIYLISGVYKYEIYESDDGTRNINNKKLLEIGLLTFNLDPTADEYNGAETEFIYE